MRADSAYDRATVYRDIENHASDHPTQTRILIPPGRNAKTSDNAGIKSAQRDENIQLTEIRIACSILNTMTKLGMPDGYCMS